MFKELCSDVDANEYSLIVDESTDIMTKKQLCVVIRYPSYSKKRIVTSFLGLMEIERGTAEVVTKCLVDFLENRAKLNIKNVLDWQQTVATPCAGHTILSYQDYGS